MKVILRAAAIAIAIAGVVDPAVARRVAVPLSIDVLMPRASDPAYPPSLRVRERIATALEGRAVLDGAEVPQAFVAVGPAILTPGPPTSRRPDLQVGREPVSGAPLFSVPLDAPASISIQTVRAPAVVPGQSAPVVATVRAVGLAGRTTAIALTRSGTAVDRIEHEWKAGDEVFEARLGFVPAAAGVHRVRVDATTSGVEGTAAADLIVVARDRRLRVLAYEPRPSWPLAFVRRSLEGDPLFDLAGTVRTTSRSATMSAGAPASLSALQADRVDAILVGAPEALSEADIRALESFVLRRGGSLILLPDRLIAEPLLRRFGFPPLEEVVLERPLTVLPPGPPLRASEMLLAPHAARGLEPLRLARHGDHDRAIITSVVRAAGRIIVSGALDAWRFRADPEASFDTLWRGLVADAAAAAPPRLRVTIEPSIARPGDDLAVSVHLRPTELTTDRGVFEIPPVSAELLSTGGGREVIRLWPGETPGVYRARVRAPRAGEYSLSVRGAGASADAPLLVAADVVHASRGRSSAVTFAALATGGAVVADVEALRARIDTLEAAEVERRTRPMRSPWWILPFAGLLTAEWALRRRGGER